MRRAMLDAMTEESMAEAARIIQQKVREGDLAAIKLMYAYGIGKPAPAVNPDRLDVEEMQLHQEGAATPASLNAIVNAMPVATALTLLRGLVPVLEQRAAAQIVNVLENGPPPAEDEDLVLEPSAGPAYDDSRHLDLPAEVDEAGRRGRETRAERGDSVLPVAAAPRGDVESDVPLSEDDLESDPPPAGERPADERHGSRPANTALAEGDRDGIADLPRARSEGGEGTPLWVGERPEGASRCQPRATPWERDKFPSPNCP